MKHKSLVCMKASIFVIMIQSGLSIHIANHHETNQTLKFYDQNNKHKNDVHNVDQANHDQDNNKTEQNRTMKSHNSRINKLFNRFCNFKAPIKTTKKIKAILNKYGAIIGFTTEDAYEHTFRSILNNLTDNGLANHDENEMKKLKEFVYSNSTKYKDEIIERIEPLLKNVLEEELKITTELDPVDELVDAPYRSESIGDGATGDKSFDIEDVKDYLNKLEVNRKSNENDEEEEEEGNDEEGK